MSLRDRLRANQRFDVDEKVKKILARWSKERGTKAGLQNLEMATKRLTAEQRGQLADRLAEISLGLLFVLELDAKAASEAAPEAGEGDPS